MTGKRLPVTTAEEYWKYEECDCMTCKSTLGDKVYDYPPINTHRETNNTHGFFDIYNFENGVAPV